MDRRDFLKSLSFLTGGALAGVVAAQADRVEAKADIAKLVDVTDDDVEDYVKVVAEPTELFQGGVASTTMHFDYNYGESPLQRIRVPKAWMDGPCVTVEDLAKL